jgi:hypothetical protein
MKTVHFVSVVALATALGWSAGVTFAAPKASALALWQDKQAPALAPRETIRIEPLDATRVRLRRSGREDWVLDSAGFTISPTWDGPPGGSVRLLAIPPGRVTAPGANFVVQEFEVMMTPSGIVSWGFGGDQRIK